MRKYEVRLEPPSLEDTTPPDLGRLLEGGIERQGGPPPNRVYAPLGVLCSLPQVLRRSGWHVTATVALSPGGYRLSSVDEGDTTGGRLYGGAAVDLGTTTIVAYIRSLVDGRILATASNYNRQISCGEDILSRVNFSRRSGLARLQQLAAESINEALTTAADAAGGIDREEILEVMIAGNTVMTHLLLGIDPPAYMIAEPYIPVVRRMLSTAAGRIGIAAHTNAGVYTFPAVSNFIGGDIIADILAAGMAEREEATLMVDIGTNFEAVLGNSDWMLSCAARPARPWRAGRCSSGCGQTRARSSGSGSTPPTPSRRPSRRSTVSDREGSADQASSTCLRSSSAPASSTGQGGSTWNSITPPYPEGGAVLPRVRRGLEGGDVDREGDRHHRERHQEPDHEQGGDPCRLHDAPRRSGPCSR